MRNTSGLTPFHDHDRASEMGRRGAAAKAKKDRESRSMASVVCRILDAKAAGTFDLDGVFPASDLKKATNQDIMLMKQLDAAMNGNVRAAEFIRDISGRSSDPSKLPIVTGDVRVMDVPTRTGFILSTVADFVVESQQVGAYWSWLTSSPSPSLDSLADRVSGSVRRLTEAVGVLSSSGPGDLSSMDPTTFNLMSAKFLSFALDFLEDAGLLNEAARFIDGKAADDPDCLRLPALADDPSGFSASFVRVVEAASDSVQDDGEGSP